MALERMERKTGEKSELEKAWERSRKTQRRIVMGEGFWRRRVWF